MSTLTVQPSAKDTYLSQPNPSTNYGSQTKCQIGDFGIGNNLRPILEFDLSGLPAGATIRSASLQLYYYWYGSTNPSGKTVWAYKLTRTDWVELEATYTIYKTGSDWTNPFGDYVTSNPSGGSTTFPAAYGWMSWNVLAIVQDAYTNSDSAEFLVKFETENLESGYSYASFYSQEYTTDNTLRPKLVVTYNEIDYERTLTTAIVLSPTLTRATTHARSLTTAIGLQASLETSGKNLASWLCVASRDFASVKTREGTTWSSCAKDASGDLMGAYFSQFDNRLCVIRYQNTGFAYSDVNDIVANWTDKPNFPNLPQKFTDMFVGRNASDTPTLYFLTPIGMFYLDVFTNFVFNPTEVKWEHDNTAGKKGLYWKGDHYIAVGKGIYKISGGVVTLVGPDMDDGLPENLQGTITDMIGVGFWLVIALDGGASKKSCILKRYITGNHWHPVYVGSLNTPIRALCWDSGTLYFGEGSNVKSLPFPTITDNVKQISDHTYIASGELIYPYFHSEFEAMPKVAHRVWATTQDCDSSETITISYRIDEETTWTELGSFESSPRPTALPFPASGDSIGVQFERIQFKAVFARGDTTTDSPKLESLILEYRVIPPVLWGWDMRVVARTQGDQRGEDIINALKTAIETGTLLSFFPSGDKSKTEYFVEVKGMPGNEAGTEFGTEGVYLVSLGEVID